MKIALAETETAEVEFFEKELGQHELEFCESADDCSEDIDGLSIFINSKIDARFLAARPNLKLIVTRSTTYDHVDLEACGQHGVLVSHVGGSYGDHTVPEHIFALMLALARKLRPALMEVVSGHSFSYEALRGVELHGRTLGVIGTGRIGRQVLKLAKAFGMETIGYDSRPDRALESDLGFKYVSFAKMLKLADFVSINVPLTPATYHLFNRDTFAKCRRGMTIINTARGPIIESESLVEALDSGIIAGAGLDVLEDERIMRKRAAHILTEQILAHLHESFAPVEPLGHNARRISEVKTIMHNNALVSHPNVIVTPHIAFNSVEAMDRINRITVENIKAFIAGTPQNLITAPPSAPRRKRSTAPAV